MFLHRFDPKAFPAVWDLEGLDSLATSLERSLDEADAELDAESIDREPARNVRAALERVGIEQALQVAVVRRIAREAGRVEDRDERTVLAEKARAIADRAWRLQRRKKRLARR